MTERISAEALVQVGLFAQKYFTPRDSCKVIVEFKPLAQIDTTAPTAKVTRSFPTNNPIPPVILEDIITLSKITNEKMGWVCYFGYSQPCETLLLIFPS